MHCRAMTKWQRARGAQERRHCWAPRTRAAFHQRFPLFGHLGEEDALGVAVDLSGPSYGSAGVGGEGAALDATALAGLHLPVEAARPLAQAIDTSGGRARPSS